MSIGDDAAIMLLAKIRKSLLLMIRQAVVEESEARHRLKICEELLQASLERRTHFPGFGNLVRAVLGLLPEQFPELDRMVTEFQATFDKDYGDVLVSVIDGTGTENWPQKAQLESLFEGVKQEIGRLSVTPEAFVRICMLNLTTVDSRIKLAVNPA